MEWVKNLLQSTPEIALFVCLALGFAVGKVKVWKLSLGGVAGTLIVSIAVGMIGGITLNDEVKNIAFALFIFTLGYISGPSFFASLNRKSLRYGVFTVIEVVTVLGLTAAATVVMGLDQGTAAGLLAGGATESAAVGTATDAIAKLPLSDEQISTLQANVGTAYSISYICGLITIVLLSSQIFPLIMRINLRDEADKLWRKLGGSSEDEDGSTKALPGLVGRAHRVEAAQGKTIADLESELGDVAVERVRRGGDPVPPEPGSILRRGDIVMLVGQREALLAGDVVIGPEIVPDGMDFDLDAADVVVNAKDYVPSSLAELRERIPPENRHGVFLTEITRMDHQLPLKPETSIHAGDTVRLTGSKSDLAEFAPRVGFRIEKGVKADFIFIAIGVTAGFLVGKLVLPLGDIPLSLGTGGGCLLTGLVCGWIRAKRPTIGQYHPAAADVIKTLGLSVFICAVGLSSGPQAVSLVKEFGAGLPIAGVLMTLVPACISLFVAWKIMKLPAPLALGSVTGQQCSTPGITAVQQAAGNATPLMAYTIVYAMSNVVLPLLGPVVVAMAGAVG
ncbi:aspartate-alanine antiporter [Stackebrandtia nassauensis]|uniref:YidE/YbjL duplication n=1 Tax=Stackebrandtia nassauensis (strain DSM 44728 / CIP 108903 / NRRL B-16338 / NBRC 102104 / LLR-40K-21) TaxID=446470 RepID=D3PYR2_STANL|nr:aspartate-alanine antiporter [Stackebrandtia nassauensis]ADD43495.1 YidE/YbjL duplication [Stackebrandtia nassauensis DSM 44728]